MCLCLQALVSRAQQVRRAACIQRAVSEKILGRLVCVVECMLAGVGVAALLVRRICEVKCRNCSRLGYKCQIWYS